MLFVSFPLLFLIFLFVFNFCKFYYYVSWHIPLVYPVYDSLHLLDWVTIFFSMLGKFSAIISSNIFSGLFSLSLFSSWDPYKANWYAWCCPRSLLDCLHFFIFFFPLFSFLAVISTILSSRSLICSSASVILLLSPSSVFFTPDIILFISACSSVLLGLC